MGIFGKQNIMLMFMLMFYFCISLEILQGINRRFTI